MIMFNKKLQLDGFYQVVLLFFNYIMCIELHGLYEWMNKSIN